MIKKTEFINTMKEMYNRRMHPQWAAAGQLSVEWKRSSAERWEGCAEESVQAGLVGQDQWYEVQQGEVLAAGLGSQQPHTGPQAGS